MPLVVSDACSNKALASYMEKALLQKIDPNLGGRNRWVFVSEDLWMNSEIRAGHSKCGRHWDGAYNGTHWRNLKGWKYPSA